MILLCNVFAIIMTFWMIFMYSIHDFFKIFILNLTKTAASTKIESNWQKSTLTWTIWDTNKRKNLTSKIINFLFQIKTYWFFTQFSTLRYFYYKMLGKKKKPKSDGKKSSPEPNKIGFFKFFIHFELLIIKK